MSYMQHFKLTDDLIDHLDGVVLSQKDPFIQSRYTGFLAVSAITVYELAVKSIFSEFANRKHKVLGTFSDSFFERLNGRIKVKVISEQYVGKYGEKYVRRFERKLAECESRQLRRHRVSVRTAYGNLILWRNEFAHEGRVPVNATYNEVKRSYHLGKGVIRCLAESMTR